MLPGCEAGALIRRAQLSDDGRYRYRLDRQWDKDAGFAVWIMLNPSTADAEVDDPTIRACMEFTRRWELGGLVVVNLFAYRATDPGVLERIAKEASSRSAEPGAVARIDAAKELATGGARNDLAIGQACVGADRVIAAWGHHGRLFWRHIEVLKLLRESGIPVYCLGRNADGTPRHPLYVKRATALVHLA